MLLDHLVIGSNLESLLYAFLNDCYYLSTNCMPPLFYEKTEQKVVGTDEKDYCWSRLTLSLSLMGKLLNYSDFTHAKIEDDLIKIFSKEPMRKYSFELCEIFDTSMLTLENQVLETRPESYIVHDDFELSSLGGKHTTLESKISKDSFATEIHYYTSDRVDGANYVTDCVVLSNLDSTQINDVNYSDSIVKFAVERHLRSIKVNGGFMGLYKNGEPKFRKPKVEHKKRLVRKVDNNKYRDTDKIKMMNLTVQEILDGHCK